MTAKEALAPRRSGKYLTEYESVDEKTQALFGLSEDVVMLPKSTKYGASSAYDPNKLGLVIVDPDYPDTSMVIDADQLSASLKRRLDANDDDDEDENPYDILRKYGEVSVSRSAQTNPFQPQPATVYSGAAPQPVTSNDYVRIGPSPQPIQQQVPQPVPQPQPQPIQWGTIGQAWGPQAQGAPAPQMPVVPLAPAAPFNVPFIDEGVVSQPKVQAIFDLGAGGQLSAMFHAVLDSLKAIVFCYDTRFQAGAQWAPPSGPIEILVSVPSLGLQDVPLVSAGLRFSLGVIDIFVLLKMPRVTAAPQPEVELAEDYDDDESDE